MKNLIFKTVFFVSIFSLTSCAAEKSIEIANGQCITEREYEKRLKRAYKQTIREMSKEDRKTIKNTRFSVETNDE
jgi:hypothetical protein